MYNAEPYLKDCLDSVTGQTYRNLEIILIDDGSTDGSGAICDAYAAKDSRIQAFHQENSGAAVARNAGLAAANGEWIGFVDSDDYIDPDQYAYLLDLARRHGADIAQCGMIFEAEGVQKVSGIPNRETCADVRHIRETRRFFANSSCCRIYRRKILIDTRFDPGCKG